MRVGELGRQAYAFDNWRLEFVDQVGFKMPAKSEKRMPDPGRFASLSSRTSTKSPVSPAPFSLADPYDSPAQFEVRLPIEATV